jgi:predicted outer membrane repeat protein
VVTTLDDVVNAEDGETSLREAIAAANDDFGRQTITFDSSLSGGTVVLTQGQLEISDAVLINGDIGGDLTRDISISGNDESRVFLIDSALDMGVTLSHMNIENGFTLGDGGGIHITGGGQLELVNMEFNGNDATGAGASGGAIYAEGGLVSLSGSELAGNTATESGGGIEMVDGMVVVNGSAFSGNTAIVEGDVPLGAGGAISMIGRSQLLVNSTDFLMNVAGLQGGAISLSDHTDASIRGSSFTSNNGGLLGGAIFMASGAHLDVLNSGFGANSAVVGQAVGSSGALPDGADVLATMGLHFGVDPEAGKEGFNLVGLEQVIGTEAGDVIVGDATANVLLGRGGNDFLAPGLGDDVVTLGEGGDLLIGQGLDLFGDTVVDFTEEDGIALDREYFDRSTLPVTMTENETTFGSEESALTLLGDFRGGNFLTGRIEIAEFEVMGTGIGFLEHLPDLAEAVRLASPDTLDKPALDLFLSGNTTYSIEINADLDGAVFRNAVGVYEIDSEGNISNVRIIDADATDGGSGEIRVSQDSELGLFIIQDGADLAEELLERRGKLWFNEDGALVVGDEVQDELIFHATRDDLNVDGLQHAVAGTLEGDLNRVRFGFEDLEGLGDGDYQDVVLTVEAEAMPEL